MNKLLQNLDHQNIRNLSKISQQPKNSATWNCYLKTKIKYLLTNFSISEERRKTAPPDSLSSLPHYLKICFLSQDKMKAVARKYHVLCSCIHFWGSRNFSVSWKTLNLNFEERKKERKCEGGFRTQTVEFEWNYNLSQQRKGALGSLPQEFA